MSRVVVDEARTLTRRGCDHGVGVGVTGVTESRDDSPKRGHGAGYLTNPGDRTTTTRSPAV